MSDTETTSTIGAQPVRPGRDVQPIPWLHLLWQAFFAGLFLTLFGHALVG